nr:hypothetical protein CparaKRNrm2_p117 [Cryptomonas paramecium]
MFICSFPTNFNLYKRTIRFKKESLEIKASLEKSVEYFYTKKLKKKENLPEYRVLRGINFSKILKEHISLEVILKAKNINLNVHEFPRDELCEVVRGPDENILDWLMSKSKLKLKSEENDSEPTQKKNFSGKKI